MYGLLKRRPSLIVVLLPLPNLTFASLARPLTSKIPKMTDSAAPPSSSTVTLAPASEHEPAAEPAPGGGSGSLPPASVLGSSEPNDADADAEFGFQRAEMGKSPLVGTVQIYDRHLFLCYKNPQVWPANVEAAEFDRLPRLLSAALKSRKGDIKKRTRLTVCEGEDGTDNSNGDVLIFPDMIRYRRLTHFDVDNFVEDVLVKETEWLPGVREVLTGSYIFVCAHGSRDRRCGVCGPLLIQAFNEKISSLGIEGKVSVSPCSHIGGHKYAGNVIIYSRSTSGQVTGHWYGYVTPEHVTALLEQHIGKGEIIDHLWRGQMGLSEEDQKKAQQLRLNSKTDKEQVADANENGMMMSEISGCCQGRGNVSCCQNGNGAVEVDQSVSNKQENENKSADNGVGKSGTRKMHCMPTWFERWDREDTYAALAVIAAVGSVAVAYSIYRQSR